MVSTVRTISSREHLAFLENRVARGGAASFLQTPAWAAVKPEWRAESIGWEHDGRLAGAGLVLYRQLPKVRRYLAYLPEGPVLDYETIGHDLGSWLEPMAEHLRARGAFGIRIGPPVVLGRWTAAQIKDGIADPAVSSLTDLPPDRREPTGALVVSQLHDLGWRQQSAAGGFAAGQPQFVFQVPLVDRDGSPRTADDVLAGMNQQWRRNIKRAARLGVEVSHAGAPDVKAFHDLYVHTAERDHFTPRPLTYFQTMYDALAGEDPDRIRLYLARHDGDLVAGTLGIRVGRHAWYSYGASSTEKRDVRGSNAIQWQMIRDAIADGASVYDLRGITDTLAEEDDHIGLIRFKVGTGGHAVQYAGEWDLPLNKAIYAAFEIYLRRRS